MKMPCCIVMFALMLLSPSLNAQDEVPQPDELGLFEPSTGPYSPEGTPSPLTEPDMGLDLAQSKYSLREIEEAFAAKEELESLKADGRTYNRGMIEFRMDEEARQLEDRESSRASGYLHWTWVDSDRSNSLELGLTYRHTWGHNEMTRVMFGVRGFWDEADLHRSRRRVYGGFLEFGVAGARLSANDVEQRKVFKRPENCASIDIGVAGRIGVVFADDETPGGRGESALRLGLKLDMHGPLLSPYATIDWELYGQDSAIVIEAGVRPNFQLLGSINPVIAWRRRVTTFRERDMFAVGFEMGW